MAWSRLSVNPGSESWGGPNVGDTNQPSSPQVQAVKLIAEGRAPRLPQPEDGATYEGIQKKETAQVSAKALPTQSLPVPGLGKMGSQDVPVQGQKKERPQCRKHALGSSGTWTGREQGLFGCFPKEALGSRLFPKEEASGPSGRRAGAGGGGKNPPCCWLLTPEMRHQREFGSSGLSPVGSPGGPLGCSCAQGSRGALSGSV